jgi:hypothetical protein
MNLLLMLLEKGFSHAYILINFIQINNSFMSWTRWSVAVRVRRRKYPVNLETKY